MTGIPPVGQQGGGPSPGVDPDAYARQYAQQKGISFEAAKAELKAMYGDPKPPQGNLFDK